MKRLLTILGALLVLTSCDLPLGTVALGTKINLKGPTLKVTGLLGGKTDMIVNDLFFLHGTASGGDRITRMEIKL